MALSRKDAFKKATIHTTHPSLPPEVRGKFPGWTHCEIRSYHRNISCHKTIRGKNVQKKSQRVEGYIFIHLARRNGTVRRAPTKKIRVASSEKMTRRDFVDYARALRKNRNNFLAHALS